MGASSRQVSVRDASARARRLSAVGGPGRPSDGKAGGQGWRTRTPYPVGGVSGQVPRSRPLTLVVVAELVHRYMMVTHDGDPLVPARSRRGRKRTRTGHPPTVCMQSAHPGLPVAHAVGSLHSREPVPPLRVRPLRATRGVLRSISATFQPGRGIELNPVHLRAVTPLSISPARPPTSADVQMRSQKGVRLIPVPRDARASDANAR
jgi:hypothetical protein